MSIATLIRSMASAGATPEAIAIAVDAIEAAQNAVAEQRAAAALRKRRQRERERDCPVTVTGQSQDIAGQTPAPSPPSPFSPQTPLKPQPPHPHPRDVAPPRKGTGFAEPAGVTAEQWAGFTGQRKKKLTERAYALLCRKLAETAARSGWPPGDLIDLATERGWETIYEPKEHRRDGQRPYHHRQPDAGPVNPMVRAGIAREARYAAAAGEDGELFGRAAA